MKKIMLILAVMLTAICVTSCGMLTNNINANETYLSVKIIQTLGDGEALAMTNKGWEYNVVKVVSNSEVYYDGKTLTGNYVLVGTYRYETVKNTIKTVPVFQRKSEIK